MAALVRTGPEFVGGNQVALLHGGRQLFPAMVAALDAARTEVWLVSYIFHHDQAGRALVNALGRAAARGVAVHLLVDGFGSLAALTWLQDQLRGSGVALRVYRPLRRWWHWLQPSQLRRLHQKLCAVDGRCAFVGGINVIDDHNDLSHGHSAQPRLDFAVALHGPVAQAVTQAIHSVWDRAAPHWREQVQALAQAADQPLRQLLAGLTHRPRASSLTKPPNLDPVAVAVVVRDNLLHRRAIERSLIAALSQAQQEVDLITPYFYPGRAFRRALKAAARRGVRVRLLLQGKLDYRLAGLAAQALYDDMLAAGIQIHEYRAAFLHAKLVRVDAHWTTVGSSNIDPLSLLLNLEANVVVHDPALAAAAAAAFEAALAAGSTQVSASAVPSGWRGRLLRGAVAWLARGYLRLAGWSGRY